MPVGEEVKHCWMDVEHSGVGLPVEMCSPQGGRQGKQGGGEAGQNSSLQSRVVNFPEHRAQLFFLGGVGEPAQVLLSFGNGAVLFLFSLLAN
jgi:hypothetical protein